jgi:hypothetical protein
MKLQLIFIFNYFVFINCLSYSNSNNFLSNYFNSKKFNSYSNNFLSNSNKNTYLSYVVSHSFQSSNQLIYSLSSSYKQNNIWVPTIMPTLKPTQVNTVSPPTLNPTKNTMDTNSIIYVVLFTIIILTLVKISYDFQTKKKPCEYVKFTSLNLTLDVNEINININEPK